MFKEVLSNFIGELFGETEGAKSRCNLQPFHSQNITDLNRRPVDPFTLKYPKWKFLLSQTIHGNSKSKGCLQVWKWNITYIIE